MAMTETERARALLKSSAETLKQSRNRHRVDDRSRLIGPHGEDLGVAADEPRFTREAQQQIDRQAREAEEQEQQRAAEAEVRRLTRRLREMESELLTAQRHGNGRGYIRTDMARPRQPRGRQ